MVHYFLTDETQLKKFYVVGKNKPYSVICNLKLKSLLPEWQRHLVIISMYWDEGR